MTNKLFPLPSFFLPNGAKVWMPDVLPQGSHEWFQARAGVPTASEMDSLLVAGKGPYGLGAGALTYAHIVAAEVLAGGPVAQSFENEHTRRGHAMEAELRGQYEMMNDTPVEEIGFVRTPIFGYSPDGFVGQDGLYEGKAPGAGKLIGMLRDPGFPKEHRTQCLGGLLATGREWIDLNAGWEDFPLLTRRLSREDVLPELDKLADAIGRFNAYVQETVDYVGKLAGSDFDAAALIADLPVAAE